MTHWNRTANELPRHLAKVEVADRMLDRVENSIYSKEFGWSHHVDLGEDNKIKKEWFKVFFWRYV